MRFSDGSSDVCSSDVWSTAHSIGEGLTFLVVGTLAALLGWRFGFWGPGVIGVVTAAGCWWLLRDRPETLGLPTVAEWRNDHYGASAETKPGPRGVLSMQLSILKIPAIWVLAVS